MSELRCPRCESAAELGRGRSAARCTSCRLIFNPARSGAAAPRVGDAPTGWQVLEEGSDVVLVRRWWASNRRLAIVAGVVFAFCAVVATFMLDNRDHRFLRRRPGGKWRVSFIDNRTFGMVGLGLAPILGYVFAAMMVNATRVRASTRGLSVRHGPLPWPGNRHLDAGDVSQIYGESRPTRTAAGPVIYDVRMLVRGHDVPLTVVRSLATPDEALFVERIIESTMGIADRPVTGEMFQKRVR